MGAVLSPGDFVLVETEHFASKLIRFGQRDYGPAARWNHVALYVGDGKIVEALTKGVVESNLDKYPPHRTKVVKIAAWGYHERDNAAAFAKKCVGEKYGWLSIVCIALKTLTKGRATFVLGNQNTTICSGLVARSLERLGFCFNPWNPADLTPAYLAQYFA